MTEPTARRHLIICGAQRSGTTTLYRLLDAHADIRMARPLRPEPKYFLDDAAASAGYARYLERCFEGESDAAWLGEKSTSYIEREDAIDRIAKVLPEARLIFVLREPAVRAYSNWCFSRDHGIETLDFAEALAAEPERLDQWDRTRYSVCPFAYAGRGHYAAQLDLWARRFPRRQIHLMTSEALFRDPATSTDLFRWLGLEAPAGIGPPEPCNASSSLAPPTTVLDALRKRYAADRQRLEAEWGLDTSVWPS